MATTCAVTVVVATYNRVDRLDLLLQALAKQEVAGGFEVVVVNDASTDDTAALLDRARASAPFPLRAIHLERNGGPAPARNAGWRTARSDLVAFVDDDCQPEVGWLAALVTALDDHDIAQGRTLIDPARARDIGPFGHTVEVLAETGFYETCNIAYRRAVLERVEGFDESFGYYAEDTDLAWRAREAGARTVFVDDAVVVHEVRPSDFRAYLRSIPRREGIVRAIARHPQVRRSYPRGVFWSRAHPAAVALVGAIGLAGARRTPVTVGLAAVAVGHYTRVAVRERQAPRRLRHWPALLPLALGADLLEVAVFARASIRYRTPFL